MQYLSVAEGRKRSGLRLVLSAHTPGPWGEAAKALFKIRKVAYVPVAQSPLEANDELRAWTGVRNAPVAVLDDEPPVNSWLEIMFLAERLGSGSSLLPDDPTDRALMLGLSTSICAPEGLGWQRRLTMFEQNARLNAGSRTLEEVLRGYGARPEAVAKALAEVVYIVRGLAQQMRRQQARGSKYLVGDRLSACDVHWACFSLMVAPLPHHLCPMPEPIRAAYENIPPEIAAAVDPALLHHRDMVFERHIGLPMDF